MLDYINTPNQFLIIDDAGFPQELKAVRKYGGQIWRITNKRVKEADQPREIAMRAWTDVDVIIRNDTTIETLKETVENTAREFIYSSNINFQYGKKYLYK
jgi:hypothetical protein